jgi:hypothetical protein
VLYSFLALPVLYSFLALPVLYSFLALPVLYSFLALPALSSSSLIIARLSENNKTTAQICSVQYLVSAAIIS